MGQAFLDTNGPSCPGQVTRPIDLPLGTGEDISHRIGTLSGATVAEEASPYYRGPSQSFRRPLGGYHCRRLGHGDNTIRTLHRISHPSSEVFPLLSHFQRPSKTGTHGSGYPAFAGYSGYSASPAVLLFNFVCHPKDLGVGWGGELL